MLVFKQLREMRKPKKVQSILACKIIAKKPTKMLDYIKLKHLNVAMKKILFIILLGICTLNAEVQREVIRLKDMQELSLNLNQNGEFLSTETYYSYNEGCLEIAKLENAVAYFANTGSPGFPYYNVLMKNDKGEYFFESYKLNYDHTFGIDKENNTEEASFLDEDSVNELLAILEKEISQAKKGGRWGFDGSNCEFALKINGTWQKAGAWSPPFDSVAYKLSLFIRTKNQSDLDINLKSYNINYNIKCSIQLP